MDAAADCNAPGAFYRALEGGEFFNAFILGEREEGAAPILEGESWMGKGARKWVLVPARRGDWRIQQCGGV
jgi:hypothetical protein